MIADMIPERVAYTQLAEECTELAHAALKLGRFADEKQAYTMGEADKNKWLGNLCEEIADVLVCVDAIKPFLPVGVEGKVEEIRREKKIRWAKRLKGAVDEPNGQGA